MTDPNELSRDREVAMDRLDSIAQIIEDTDQGRIIINFPADAMRELLAHRAERARVGEGDVEAAGEVCIVKVAW